MKSSYFESCPVHWNWRFSWFILLSRRVILVKAQNMHINKKRVILKLNALLFNLSQIAFHGNCLHILLTFTWINYATWWPYKDREFNECKRCTKSAWRKGMQLIFTNSIIGNIKEKNVWYSNCLRIYRNCTA